MKTILTLASLPVIALTTWTASLTFHKDFNSLEVVPEWNGPDYLVTYNCDDYNKIKDIDMVDNGETVTVNYGALARRYQKFVCND